MLNMQMLEQYFPVGATDVKRAIIVPRNKSALQTKLLANTDCVDDDPQVGELAAKLGYPNATCTDAVKALGCDKVVAHFHGPHYVPEVAHLKDYCPRSCP